MSIEERKNNYLVHAKRFGMFPLLYLLEEYENSENYEECHILLLAIQEKSEQIQKENTSSLTIPTHIKNVAKSWIKKYLPDNIKEQMKFIKESQKECLVK